MPGFTVLSFLCSRASAHATSYDPMRLGMTDVIIANEILEHIFEFLDVVSLSRCSRTCRTFAHVRWPIINLSQCTHRLNAAQLKFLMSKQPSKLTLPSGFVLDDKAAEALSKFGGNHLVLRFSAYRRNLNQTESLPPFLRNCTKVCLSIHNQFEIACRS